MSKQSGVKGRLSDLLGFHKPQAQLVTFAIFVLLLITLFSYHLYTLLVRVVHDDLHSYIPLVPFISAYIVYVLRRKLPEQYSSSPSFAILPLVVAIASLLLALVWKVSPPSLIVLSFVCFLAVGVFVFLGKNWMKAIAFPFAFLFFMVPLPDSVAEWLEKMSKLASADSASFFLQLTGTPVLRDGAVFQLPGIVIEVAKECSGIRSSWILLISSILTAYLFLKRPSNRLILVLAAIPLGVLRNGLRIAVIGVLCVQLGPQVIHSALHRHGGPLFFALSLVPLFFLLLLLRRFDRVKTTARGNNDRSITQKESALLTTSKSSPTGT